MTNIQFPKSPAQAYRETTAEVVAYNTGVVLRIIWEVAKPLMKWALVISIGLVAATIYFFWQVIFGTMKK
jgi:hypothetical protein